MYHWYFWKAMIDVVDLTDCGNSVSWAESEVGKQKLWPVNLNGYEKLNTPWNKLKHSCLIKKNR